MKKHVMIAATVAAFGLAPLAAVAQDRAVPATSSVTSMSPQNAGGMTQGRSDSLRNDSASGLAHENSSKMTPQTTGDAPAVKTTGASGTSK